MALIVLEITNHAYGRAKGRRDRSSHPTHPPAHAALLGWF